MRTRGGDLMPETIPNVGLLIVRSDPGVGTFDFDRQKPGTPSINRVFSHDVTAAILVSQNNETAAMLVSQTSPVGVELLSYANAFFCSYKFAWTLAT